MSKRERRDYGSMSSSTLEAIVSKALAHAEHSCTFAFQGGEPMLAGLSFYKTLLKLQNRYNPGVKIVNIIQTNGYLIDDEWASFFAKNHFLVGISLDGTKEVHDANRINKKGGGTFEKVMTSIEKLKAHLVEYNILTVVTAQAAKNINEIYTFYKRSGFIYQQYIPCLDPLGEIKGQKSYSLTPELYGQFLMKLFDLWYKDMSSGNFIYNRYFENIVGILKGYKPESCGMTGHCIGQFVIEADGSVYPCDFYVFEKYRSGNFATDSFEEIQKQVEKNIFIDESLLAAVECEACSLKFVCRGGCRRDRDTGTQLERNYYCSAYRAFFSYAIDRFMTLVR